MRQCSGQMHRTVSTVQFYMPGIVPSQRMGVPSVGDTDRVQ